MFKFKRVKTDNDLVLLSDKDEEIFPHDERLEDIIDNQVWHLAYVDGKVVGFCGLKLFQGKDYNYAFLARSGVLPEYRGKGFQKQAIKLRERIAKQYDVDSIITYTSYENLPSANNLISERYKLYTPQHEYGLEYALYFRKDL